MSIARKAKKRAADATVDGQRLLTEGEKTRRVDTVEQPPVEPMGAPGADGNDAARAAFLRDVEAPTSTDDAASGEDSAPKGLSVAQLALMGVAVIDVGGQLAGPMAVKGSTAEEWALSEPEQQTAADAFVPWLEENLAGTEVSPAMVAFGTLASLYGMRAMKITADMRARRRAAPPAPAAAPPAPAAAPPAPAAAPPAPAAAPPAPAARSATDKRNGW